MTVDCITGGYELIEATISVPEAEISNLPGYARYVMRSKLNRFWLRSYAGLVPIGLFSSCKVRRILVRAQKKGRRGIIVGR